ncbi:drug/metabolite transporter (DMT)-like permease [Primorskyibacter sedentarius]|uniref:Drug/metabolite transporter (DMT)-like permease n=2 Tax=Primorskyibacter sedentarius TaxID=745311 RepID=A0A4R3JI39_9RHOB|nr:drug/metabolite transporter (DMT)-like permease [Primorskyibacter sedentarius]
MVGGPTVETRMSVLKPKEDRPGLGLLLMAMAVLGFTCIDTSAKWLMLSGLAVVQVVFLRYLGHFILSLVVFLPTEGAEALRSKSPKLQMARSACLLGSTALNFVALQFLPITVTTAIMFSMPVTVTVLSVLLLGETVGLRRVLAVLVGFCGVLVVVQPWGVDFHPAIFLSLGALCCASLYFVMTRMLAGKESNATSQIWSSGLAALCMLPLVIHHWQWPDSTVGWVVMGLIGTFGFGAHAAATVAHRLADASLLAPMNYLQLISASAAGVLVFGTWPTMWTLAGALIIVGSGLYIWRRERRLGREARQTPPVR